MLLAPLPIGYFIRNRMAAYLALHSFVFTFQSTCAASAVPGAQHPGEAHS